MDLFPIQFVRLMFVIPVIFFGALGVAKNRRPEPDCLEHRHRSGLQALLLEQSLSGPIQLAKGLQRSPGEIVMDWFPAKLMPIVVSDANDLRFLPHTLPGSTLVLMVNQFDLASRQVDQVLAVAATLRITIHLFWLADSHSIPSDARRLVEGVEGQIRTMHSLLTRPDCSELSIHPVFS